MRLSPLLGTPAGVCLLVAVAMMGMASGCHTHAMHPERAYAQWVTAESEGRFWITGSEGFAAYFDGQRMLRRDYPPRENAPSYAYEMSSDVPVARVVIYRGQPWMFTRAGDVLRWTASGWRRVPVRFPPTNASSPDEPAQIDAVLVAPDGRLLIQLHAYTLAWTDEAGLLAGRFDVETVPTYFTWIGVIDGALYGLGWNAPGNDRAVYRRDANQRWTVFGMLAPETSVEHYRALIPTRSGNVVAVASRGLVAPAPEVAQSSVTPANALPLHSLPGSNATVAPGTVQYFFDAVTLGPRSAALFAGGGGNTVVEADAESNYLHACSQGTALYIGAVPIRGGLRLVTTQAAVVDSSRDGCQVRAPAIINR